MMKNPVRSPMVPPMRLSWASVLIFLSISKSSRPRKAFLSSRLVGSAASPICQPAGSSIPSYKRKSKETLV